MMLWLFVSRSAVFILLKVVHHPAWQCCLRPVSYLIFIDVHQFLGWRLLLPLNIYFLRLSPQRWTCRSWTGLKATTQRPHPRIDFKKITWCVSTAYFDQWNRADIFLERRCALAREPSLQPPITFSGSRPHSLFAWWPHTRDSGLVPKYFGKNAYALQIVRYCGRLFA